jgi:MFS family permease
VAAAYHDDVEIGGKIHGGGEFYASVSRETSRRRCFTWNNVFAAMQQKLWCHNRRLISLTSYASLLAKREVRLTFLASVVGRLPIGVTGLAMLILVQSSRGSFGQGGAATACYLAGLAAIAPGLGRLIDRHGPRWILLGCALAFPAALALLVASTAYRAPFWWTLLAAATAGASFPPITVCMRAYLRQRFADDPLLGSAYALESVLIEMIFIVGPLLVALFVAAASPATAVWFAAGCACAGSVLFLRSPALKTWRIEARSAPSLLGPLGERDFVALIAVVTCFSGAFGLMEIGVTAYAAETGAPALAGVLLGLMSVGSACGGLAYGSRTWNLPLVSQFALALAVMGAGLVLLSLADDPWFFAALCVAGGVVMAPALIMQSMLVAKTARPEYSTEAFTWSASALLAGIGLGLAAGGALLETYRSSAPLAASGATALLAALVARLVLRR